MTTRTTTAFGVLSLLLCVAAAIRGQELPLATAQYGAFALPDGKGTRLLAPSDLPQPDRIHDALCSDGRRVPVRFDRRQVASDNNARQLPSNFDKLAGNVFTVLQGQIGRGQDTLSVTCFVASTTLLSSGNLLRVQPLTGSTECGTDVGPRLASSRNRPVVRCGRIAGLPDGRNLVLAQFARQGTDALASMVLLDRDRTIFADYPAKYEKEGADLWRADDGGVMSPDNFQVVFLLQRGDSYVLGLSWAGAEGSSLTVAVSRDATRFTNVIVDYWYRGV
jgi:hypothetical protein